MSDKRNFGKFEAIELSDDELGMVTGGSYVNVNMTIGDIVGTDRNLMAMLVEAGINVSGNKGLLGLSLYDAAASVGADSYSLEARMNEYLSGK